MTRRLAGAFIAVVVLSGCGRAGLPAAATEQGRQTVSLWKLFLVIAAILAVVVYGLIAFVVIRYRHRRHDDGAVPSQRREILSLELLYTAVPLVIVGVLLGLSTRTQEKVTRLSDHPDLEVEIIGFQWQWQFRYPGGTVVTGTPDHPPVLELPVGRTVQLHLVSRDVIHSFWVPRFIEKRDLVPGIDNKIDVRLTAAGEFPGVCSEFCGLDHWRMTFSVRAVPPDDFDAWLAKGGTP
jgi:cytochrome c oxidase subunit 2